MLRRAGHAEDMSLVWEYLKETLSPFIKAIYQECAPAMKAVPNFDPNLDVWGILKNKMTTLTSREVRKRFFKVLRRLIRRTSY